MIRKLIPVISMAIISMPPKKEDAKVEKEN